MSLINVKVLDNAIEVREGISKTGKPYKMIQQSNIIVELGNEVRQVSIQLQDGHPPFSAGKYTLDPVQMIAIGRYGFELNRYKQIELVPVVASAIPRTV